MYSCFIHTFWEIKLIYVKKSTQNTQLTTRIYSNTIDNNFKYNVDQNFIGTKYSQSG